MTDLTLPASSINWTDAKRLAALQSYGILDTPAEQAYDDFVKLAQLICGTDVARINLIDADRQFLKAEIGLSGFETASMPVSICAHAILQPDLFVVPDITLDPRFLGNPILGPPHHLRFYAGALLVTPEGHALGTICVLDTTARPNGLTGAQHEALQALARQVMITMELRRALADKSRAEAALAAAFQTNSDILASIDDPFLVLDCEFDIVFANHHFAGLIGASDALIGKNLLRLLADFPDHAISPVLVLVRQVMSERVSARGEMFSTVLGRKWVDVSVYPISNGGISLYVRDIDLRKHLEAELEAAVRTMRDQLAEKELLMLETHHRVKNSLQMVQSLLTLQARNIAEPGVARKVLESAARVRIFGALHETLYRVADGTHVDMAAYLEMMVADLNAGMGATLEGRPIRLDAQSIRWPSADATIVGLVLSELVTNALKYGSGAVDVRLRADAVNSGDAVLTVMDEGVSLPKDFDPTTTNGMGMRLMCRLLRDRGGRLEIDPSSVSTRFCVTFNAKAASVFEAGP